MTDLDYTYLNKELSKVKAKVFAAKHSAAFLGSLMRSLEFLWDEEIQTACTNGTQIRWNPHYFMALTYEGRRSILIHELWHVAKLHVLRRGNRNPKIWNFAADTDLDNNMHQEGYDVSPATIFPQPMFPANSNNFVNPKYIGMSVEEIYDDMIKDVTFVNLNPISLDIEEPASGDAGQHQIINLVVQAHTAAKLAGEKPGDKSGDIESILKQFLQPKLPWETLLMNFLTELSENEYTLARPNRRYEDVYISSLVPDNNGLTHIAAFIDVSGSVTDPMVIRIMSELKYIKDAFNPEKVTLILFDTKINAIYDFSREDEFEKLVIVGRGGTSLHEVREYIQKNQPNAAIVFSDLECTVMQKLTVEVPIIWICINNSRAQVNEGKLIHIRE